MKVMPSIHLILVSTSNVLSFLDGAWQVSVRTHSDATHAGLKLCSCCHAANPLELCIAICQYPCVCGLAVLLLRHRGRIPPFSSYGGIFKARSPDRAFFFLKAIRSPGGRRQARPAGRLTAGLEPRSNDAAHPRGIRVACNGQGPQA